jgi:hypothetical protein
MLDIQKKKDKVMIIGRAFTWRLAKDIVDKDSSWEVWVINDMYDQFPNADLWFEMHDRGCVNTWIGPGGINHLEWLKQAKMPIIMQEHYDDIPNSVRFPKEEMTKEFNNNYFKTPEDYNENDGSGVFTSSFSYMLALAITMQYKTIGIYGIHLSHYSEYQGQREGCKSLMWYARGKGINLQLPKECPLILDEDWYGYTDYKKGKVTIDKKYFIEKRIEIENEHSRLMASLNAISGARQMLINLVKNASGHSVKRLAFEVTLEEFIQKEKQLEDELNKAQEFKERNNILSYIYAVKGVQEVFTKVINENKNSVEKHILDEKIKQLEQQELNVLAQVHIARGCIKAFKDLIEEYERNAQELEVEVSRDMTEEAKIRAKLEGVA